MRSGANYWFPAKRYGWGWGFPITWQGWLVFAAFFVLLALGVFLFPPQQTPALYFVYIVVLSAILVGICWLKGEPPRWRWG
ncbi:MAG TPA: hypothetical protein VNV38_02815 [Stellaceae bacterium]|jgi:hypothetical protein|nr:hypothetical protein [Stellaceae bacterium]